MNLLQINRHECESKTTCYKNNFDIKKFQSFQKLPFEFKYMNIRLINVFVFPVTLFSFWVPSHHRPTPPQGSSGALSVAM